MEAKALELFKKFTDVTILYRTDDGEYFIELVDCQAYLTIRGAGTYSTVERTIPLPTIPTPWVEPPIIWGVVNNPLAYNAAPHTNPTLYPQILIYNVSEIGSYVNFRDNTNNALIVTSDDLESGLVQFRWETYWKKLVLPLSVNGKVSTGDFRAVTGDTVYKALPALIQGKNLFDVSSRKINFYVSNTGTVAPQSNWETTDYIPVTPGQYTISGTKDRVGVGFYNASKATVRYQSLNLGTITVQEGEAFVVFNLKSASSGPYSNVQFEAGAVATSYEEFGKKRVAKAAVEGLPALETKVNAFPEPGGAVTPGDNKSVSGDTVYKALPTLIQGKNLFDISSRKINFYVSNTGAVLPIVNWECTDYIPVTPGQYTISGTKDRVGVGFYNATKETVRFVSLNLGTITVQEGESFVVFNLKSASSGPYSNVQFEAGAVATSYEEFGKKRVAKAAVEGLPALETKVNALSGGRVVTFSINEAGMTTIDSDGLVINSIPNSVNIYDGSRVFNFASWAYKGYTKAITDDVAPMHIYNYTMGANHGYIHYRATIAGHPFTNADVGTEFSQAGLKFYLARVVSSSIVAFLAEFTGDAIYFSVAALTTGTITRGVDSWTITAVEGKSLFPAIQNLVKWVKNEKGNLISGNGDAEYVEVIESYTITNPISLLENLKSRAPGDTSDPSFAGTADVLVENIYRFQQKSVLVFANIQTLNSVRFKDIMCSQAISIGAKGSTHYYIPNSAPLNASVDLRKPTLVPWDETTPSTFVVNIDQPDPNNPPNRVINYLNGEIGFMIGYIPGAGMQLKDYTTRTFEIRNNTGKIYPHPVDNYKVGSPLPANTFYSIGMYRAYTNLTKTRTAERLSIFEVPVNGVLFVFLDYSASVLDTIFLDTPGISGRKIEVVESRNADLKTVLYNNSLKVNATYVEGETSYIVLKINLT